MNKKKLDDYIQDPNYSGNPQCERHAKCMLVDMWDKQKFLQSEKFIKDMVFENDIDRQKYINMMILACYDEIAELQRETSWKSKKLSFGWQNKIAFDKKKVLAEGVDLFHFLMNIMLAINVTAEEFYNEYCKKVEENWKRQRDGY